MLLANEVERLKKKLLELSALVEDSVRRALTSIDTGDQILAHEVIAGDADVDEAEVDLKILALHQPVAVDLRYIVAIMKINNDIERIGDMAVNIAKRSLDLAPGTEMPATLPDMAEKVRSMLRMSLDALVDSDGELARKVLVLDDDVDAMHRGMFDRLTKKIENSPQQAIAFLPFLTVSRNLERIADLATNISEDVIYLVEGEIVRHQHSD